MDRRLDGLRGMRFLWAYLVAARLWCYAPLAVVPYVWVPWLVGWTGWLSPPSVVISLCPWWQRHHDSSFLAFLLLYGFGGTAGSVALGLLAIRAVRPTESDGRLRAALFSGAALFLASLAFAAAKVHWSYAHLCAESAPFVGWPLALALLAAGALDAALLVPVAADAAQTRGDNSEHHHLYEHHE